MRGGDGDGITLRAALRRACRRRFGNQPVLSRKSRGEPGGSRAPNLLAASNSAAAASRSTSAAAPLLPPAALAACQASARPEADHTARAPHGPSRPRPPAWPARAARREPRGGDGRDSARPGGGTPGVARGRAPGRCRGLLASCLGQFASSSYADHAAPLLRVVPERLARPAPRCAGESAGGAGRWRVPPSGPSSSAAVSSSSAPGCRAQFSSVSSGGSLARRRAAAHHRPRSPELPTQPGRLQQWHLPGAERTSTAIDDQLHAVHQVGAASVLATTAGSWVALAAMITRTAPGSAPARAASSRCPPSSRRPSPRARRAARATRRDAASRTGPLAAGAQRDHLRGLAIRAGNDRGSA